MTDAINWLIAKIRDFDDETLLGKLDCYDLHDVEIARRFRKLRKEVDRLRDVATQAVAVIKSVQDYEQPDDVTWENALAMCEHEVFDFDVDAALDVLKAWEEADAPQE